MTFWAWATLIYAFAVSILLIDFGAGLAALAVISAVVLCWVFLQREHEQTRRALFSLKEERTPSTQRPDPSGVELGGLRKTDHQKTDVGPG